MRPYKIGLIGVPGSGKTDLAEGLLSGPLKDLLGTTEIVDAYATEVSEYIDIAKGLSASWYLDLQISLERLARERQAARDGAEVIITCGTLIESTSYSMLNFENRKDFKIENEQDAEIKRIQAAMMVNACLFMDTFSYDKIFFLNQIEPTAEEPEMFKVLDRNIRGSFAAFQLTNVSEDLTVETLNIEEATKQRLEIIGDLSESISQREDVQPEGSDGRGVREGEEAESEEAD